ncbi:YkvA family protein [Streptomyces sp. TRM 70351]|uniref:YkvA family protein n=1 Tax=Streptomyces sp. TRM 70351 TaxID=3116552 RepID=UPI002E7C2705|nr:YkvA family protein [Streptomyces sp. TRM 70351]MEE1927780.1 YkvA family protein [Streptomyces sp. TRM 70351]
MSTQNWVLVGVLGALALATLVLAVRLAHRVVSTRRLLRDAGLPQQSRFTTWAAVLYLVSPVDLMPDPVLLDDIGVLLLALRSLHGAAEKAGLGRPDGRPGKKGVSPRPQGRRSTDR